MRMRKPFTLVELLIAMSVLSVFLLGLMQFYSTTEDVMSAAAARTELFERARIAMDLMANDLACMYYSQTDENMRPYYTGSEPESTDTSNWFQVATIRPEKLDLAAKTSIVGVKYTWNSGDSTLEYATNGRDYFNAKDDIGTSGETLIEGVTDFSVRATYNGSKTVPDSVLIRMELVDGKTLQRLVANPDSKAAILKNAKKREFRRLVIIDRGQREITL